MIKPGMMLTTKTGRTLKVLEGLGIGGQGTVVKARDMASRRLFAVKIFHPAYANAETIARLEYLYALRLHALCPVFVGPLELIHDHGQVGYIADYIPGKPLKEFLEKETCKFMELLVLALTLANAFAKLHDRNIANGDIREANVLVRRNGAVICAHIIDNDNFNAPSVPKPPCYGNEVYFSPELYAASVENRVRHPDIGSDKYEFFVLMHETILLKHPAAGWMKPEERFNYAMYKGIWRHHPYYGTWPADVKGYPPRTLNARLINLFNQGISLDPDARPSTTAWREALFATLGEVHICEACGWPCLVDVSKTICPSCQRPYPVRKLVLPSGHSIQIDAGYMPIGRNELNGAMMVSAIHAVFRRIGPEVIVESLGQNGTYRKTDKAWVRLPPAKPVTLYPGDVLRLADIEVRIE